MRGSVNSLLLDGRCSTPVTGGHGQVNGRTQPVCDRPLFTGYTRDGGFATHTVADARYAFPLGEDGDDVAIAPLLCAGLIGWRSLVMAGDGERLGIYGFGAAGHIVAQVALWQGRSVCAFTRRGDTAAQGFARRLCVLGDTIVAGGSSPSTVTIYDLRGNETLLSVNLTLDIRNAIHGLAPWPFD